MSTSEETENQEGETEPLDDEARAALIALGEKLADEDAEAPTEDAEVEETDAKPEEQPKPEEIENAVPKGKNIATLTEAGNGGMPEGWFDNFGTPDLRTYLKFWEDEKRSAGKAEHLLSQDPDKWGWLPNREAHVAALKEEIALREAKRSQGGPGAGPRVEKPAEATTESTPEASDTDQMTDEELEAATAPAETA